MKEKRTITTNENSTKEESAPEYSVDESAAEHGADETCTDQEGVEEFNYKPRPENLKDFPERGRNLIRESYSMITPIPEQ